MPHEDVKLRVEGRYAIITLNRPKKLNSLGPPAWRRLAELIKEAEALPNTFVTIVTGVGSFFSAGADVSADYGGVPGESAVVSAAKSFAGLNMLTAEAISKHPKITVAALNGPAIGIAAGLLGYFDFIYAVDSAWISTPFVNLGLVAEGGASYSYPQRMGLALAKEVLLFGDRIPVAKLLPSNFINELLPAKACYLFLADVIALLDKKLENVDPESVLANKKLINSHLPDLDGPALREIYQGMKQSVSGKPAIAFARIAEKNAAKVKSKI